MIDECAWMDDQPQRMTPYDLKKAEAIREAYTELEKEYVTEKKEKWWKKFRPYVGKQKNVHGANVKAAWLFGVKIHF